jgi:hypothetical protein
VLYTLTRNFLPVGAMAPADQHIILSSTLSMFMYLGERIFLVVC